MTANLGYVDAPTLMGSWPMASTGALGPSSGDFTLFPRSFIAQATILAGRQDPASGFDVNGTSFDLDVDGSTYPVSFASGPLSLDSVVSEINSDVGSAVAFNDNGFLRLKSPTVGDGSSLSVSVDSSGPGVLAELGLLSGAESYAGDILQAQHVDPNRAIATHGQIAPNYGETFDQSAFNRMALQLAVNCDRSARLIDNKRVSIQKEYAVASYTPGATPGVLLPKDVYVGDTTTPTSVQLERLFAVLDTDGNEFTKEVEEITDTSGAYTVEADYDESYQVQYVILEGTHPGMFTATDDTENVYVRLSGLSGTPTANDKLFKIIEYVDARKVGIKSTDPATGARIEFDEGPSAAIDLERVVVTPTQVVVEEVQASAGGARVENVAQSRTTSTAITRIERNNRLVCDTADFVSDGVIPGDRVQLSGAGQDVPFNNDGWYRVLTIVDENTVELIGDDYTPVFLNSVEGTGYGSIVIQSDGAFFNTPFLKFNIHPDSGDSFNVVYMELSNLRDASDDPAFLGGGGIRYSQEADANVQHALLAIIGPSASSLSEYLHDDARNSLENLYYRITKEHDDVGRHTTIYPEEVWVGPPDAPLGVSEDSALPRPFVHIDNDGNVYLERVNDTTGPTIRLTHYSDTITSIVGPCLWFDSSHEGWQTDYATQIGSVLGTVHVTGRNSSDVQTPLAKVVFKQHEGPGTYLTGQIQYHLSGSDSSDLEELARLTNGGDPDELFGNQKAGIFRLYSWGGDEFNEPVLALSTSADDYPTLGDTTDGEYLGRVAFESVNASNARVEAGYVRAEQDGPSGTQVPTKLVMGVATGALAPADIVQVRRDATDGYLEPANSSVSLGRSGAKWKYLWVSSVAGEGCRTDLVPFDNDVVSLGSLSYQWSLGYIMGLHTSELHVSDSAGDGVATNLVPTAAGWDLGNTTYRWDLWAGSINTTYLNVSTAADEGVGTDLIPTDTGDLDLGSSTYEWNALYCQNAYLQSASMSTLSLSTDIGDGVQTDLVPGTGSLDLGNTGFRWDNLFLSGYMYSGTATIYAHLGNSGSSSSLTGYSPESAKKPFYIQNLYNAGGTPAGDLDMYFRVGNSASPTMAMQIDGSTGYVGIGIDPATAGVQFSVNNYAQVRGTNTDAYLYCYMPSGLGYAATIRAQNAGTGRAQVEATAAANSAFLKVSRPNAAYGAHTVYKEGAAEAWRTGLRAGVSNSVYYIEHGSTGIISYFNSSGNQYLLGSLYPYLPLTVNQNIGSSSLYWYRGYFNNIYYKFTPTTFDSYDDLALIEGYSPSGEEVEMKKGDTLRKVQLADASTLPWPCLGDEKAPDDTNYIDAASSITFILGAIKQLYQKHKDEVSALRAEIQGLKEQLA